MRRCRRWPMKARMPLSDDLALIADSLLANGHDDLAGGELQDWLDRAAIFGFHLARLDIREDAQKLREVVAELLTQIGLTNDYEALDEQGKQQLLTSQIDPARASKLNETSLSEQAQEMLRLFRLIQQTLIKFGPKTLGNFVISMTHHPSDALTVLWLHRFAAQTNQQSDPPTCLPIVPLFETIDDLDRAGTMLEQLLSNKVYARHVRACGNLQTCMVGYSDSTKDGGNFAANWALYEAQRRLADVADRHGTRLMLFHGRGGALGRGGGPAARGIRSLPPQSVRGKLRMTEQGEVLAERYDDPEIAHRHLEQVSWATILVSADVVDDVRPEWVETMREAAKVSQQHYRDLVDNPGFITYFGQATPIESIETLPIASRPSRRRGRRRLEDLRPFLTHLPGRKAGT